MNASRDSVEDLGRLWSESFPEIVRSERVLSGGDLIPKPRKGRVPLLITGSSRQSLDWIAANADGWLTYPRSVHRQAAVVAEWNETLARVAGDAPKPVAQSLYIDLVQDPVA